MKGKIRSVYVKFSKIENDTDICWLRSSFEMNLINLNIPMSFRHWVAKLFKALYALKAV